MDDLKKERDTRNSLAIFRGKEIRKILYKDEWWFVIEDVVRALTDSTQPKGYIKDMRRRDEELSLGWGQIATLLAINTAGGKQKLNVQIQKVSFVLFNQYRAQKPNHSNAGWQKLVMSEYKKLKIQNLQPNALTHSTKPKDILILGLGKECAVSRYKKH